MELIYLDWAATTPVSNDVLQEIVRVFKDYPGNPSSMHLEGKRLLFFLKKTEKDAQNFSGFYRNISTLPQEERNQIPLFLTPCFSGKAEGG